jgi:hypothetical protein
MKDSPCDSAGSPGKHDKTHIEPSDRYESWLAIVLARIRPCEVRASKDLLSPNEIQPALSKRLLSLGPIARDAHLLL